MKTLSTPFIKKTIINLLFLSILLGSACKKDDESSAEVKFNNISVTGAQEAPNPITTSATGNLNATYNKDTNILTYTITYSGITPTAMHFHKGAPGVAGGVEIGINGPYSSPINGATIPLTEEQETDLLAGNWYVNLHSDTYKAGEIRGQLLAN